MGYITLMSFLAVLPPVFGVTRGLTWEKGLVVEEFTREVGVVIEELTLEEGPKIHAFRHTYIHAFIHAYVQI